MSEKPYSDAQRAAIQTTDRNLIVVAGAGSGKTFVLVERFLYLLEQHPDWPLNALVAITFTQKAASEMRSRVRKELEKRAQAAAADDPETRARWTRHLTAMDSARIGTIHALCASILRANAAEAGLDPDFIVLDEVGAAILLEDAVDDTLRQCALNGDPALVLFDEYQVRAIRDVLMRYTATSDLMTTDERMLRDPAGYWRAVWVQEAGDWVRWLRENGDFWAWVDNPTPFPVPEGDRLSDVWLSMQSWCDTLRSAADLEPCVEALRRMEKGIVVNVGAASAWGGKEALSDVKERLKLIRETAHGVLEAIGDPPNESDDRAARMIPHWTALITAARTTYAQAKQAQSALDFNDLEICTRDLLLQFESVRARYRGAEFKHIMVDEFQDTNAAQWQIVTALADPAQGGSIFVVGDPKQSIYAFRGADVGVFEALRVEQSRQDAWREVVMTQSFRTHQLLVDGFNALFSQILTRESVYHVGYDAMSAVRKAPEKRPPVAFMLLDKNQISEDEETASEVNGARRWEARALAERLRTIVEVEGWMIYDRERHTHRRITYGDVALLFQAMTHASIYEAALKSAGLPYVTVAGRGYYDRQEVWDVLNLLRALHNPSDDLSLAAALRSPMFSLSDDALMALRLIGDPSTGKPIPLWDALGLAAADASFVPAEEGSMVAFAWACLTDLHRRVGRVTIHELLQTAMNQTGYMAILTGLPDGARRRGNVEKLLDKAATSGKISLGSFARYLSDLSESEIREGEVTLDVEGAIQLMTVHKSKGLEFPLVVLVDQSYRFSHPETLPVTWDPVYGLVCGLSENAQEDHTPFALRRADQNRSLRENAERRRLLYVAATRAQDYLLFSGQVSENKKGGWRSTGCLSWLIDAFALNDFAWSDGSVLDTPCGKTHLLLPAFSPDDIEGVDEAFVTAWESDAEPVVPPLVHAVSRDRDAPARTMTATQISDLGAAMHAFPAADRPIFADRWRRSVLFQAPGHIQTVSDRGDRAFRRRIGEIVHEVLRVGDLYAEQSVLKGLIRSLAWENGIVDDDECEATVRESLALLRKVANSDVQQMLREAVQVYRELPFVFKSERRLIQGVMDVLFQRRDGSWAIIDYKTNAFPPERRTRDFMDVHARRYALQVGVYAAAVNELLGVVPETLIHYIRYDETVLIPENQWRSVLVKMDTYIGDLMGDE
ncbi:MAG: UvrD-helicase domain-containing protein [Anaerolineae bacterium]